MLRRSLLGVAGALALPAGALQAAGAVRVLYAGSLVALMERGLGPAFQAADGDAFVGFAGGSNGLANQIKGRLRSGDVFISANPGVNDALMGPANGDWVRWYVLFAQSPLVIGYNPQSPFAADLKSKPWYKTLQEPGIKIGRTDPVLDPKGRLTVQLLQKAAEVYKQPDLAQRVLGAPENPDQVSPEETLVGRLQSGQIDVGFFYSTETADLHIPKIDLPPEVALSAHYTASMLKDGPNPTGASRFIAFLLSPAGRAIMQAHGLDVVKPVAIGATSDAPLPLRTLLDQLK
jgi:molybdate/tungstate transport system substrate-binding protein